MKVAVVHNGYLLGIRGLFLLPNLRCNLALTLQCLYFPRCRNCLLMGRWFLLLRYFRFSGNGWLVFGESRLDNTDIGVIETPYG